MSAHRVRHHHDRSEPSAKPITTNRAFLDDTNKQNNGARKFVCLEGCVTPLAGRELRLRLFVARAKGSL
jgi:hypothetical protein